MKLIASTYCPQGDVSKFIHSNIKNAEVLTFDMFDTEVRTNAIKRIIIEMRNGPTPDFHEEIEKFFLEEESEGMLRAVKTSTGNVIVTGSALDWDADTLIIFGCDSTRGRVLQDVPNLKEIFPSSIDWDFYASSGPMWYSNDSTIQKLSDWEANGYIAEDLDFYPEYSILPWEDHADYLIRTREINNNEYVEEFFTALRSHAFNSGYDHESKVQMTREGRFVCLNYQAKLLSHYWEKADWQKRAQMVDYVSSLAYAQHNFMV